MNTLLINGQSNLNLDV